MRNVRFKGISRNLQRLILGGLSRSSNATDSLKIKTQHPCRQTRVSKNETLKVLSAVDFIFQINSTRTAREGCLPKEDQNSSSVLREVSPAAVIFYGGLITLPPVPLRFECLQSSA